MRKTIGVLAVLLAAQVALAVALNYHGSRLSEAPAQVALFDATPKAVDKITIEGPNGAKTVLARAGGGWQLPDQGNFPADSKKVDDMLAKLLGLKEGLPVATSKDALGRFKLSEDDYQRRITLAKGDETLGTLYLGSSQGTRAVHARRGDQDAVYEVTFAIYEAPAGSDDWIDQVILQLPKDAITAIDVDGLHLVSAAPETAKADTEAKEATTATATADKPDDGKKAADPVWQLAEAGDAALKPQTADKLAGLLADLRISAVLGSEAKPEYGLDKPVLALTLTRKNGAKIDYALGKAPDKDDYTLKTSTRPEYFKMSSYSAKELVKAAGRDALLETPAADHHAAAADDSDAAKPATANN